MAVASQALLDRQLARAARTTQALNQNRKGKGNSKSKVETEESKEAPQIEESKILSTVTEKSFDRKVRLLRRKQQKAKNVAENIAKRKREALPSEYLVEQQAATKEFKKLMKRPVATGKQKAKKKAVQEKKKRK